MRTIRTVFVTSLGKCAECGGVFTDDTEVPPRSIQCPHCGHKLESDSWGVYPVTGVRYRWVGQDGEWTAKEPEELFVLFKWGFVVRPSSGAHQRNSVRRNKPNLILVGGTDVDASD